MKHALVIVCVLSMVLTIPAYAYAQTPTTSAPICIKQEPTLVFNQTSVGINVCLADGILTVTIDQKTPYGGWFQVNALHGQMQIGSVTKDFYASGYNLDQGYDLDKAPYVKSFIVEQFNEDVRIIVVVDFVILIQASGTWSRFLNDVVFDAVFTKG